MMIISDNTENVKKYFYLDRKIQFFYFSQIMHG